MIFVSTPCYRNSITRHNTSELTVTALGNPLGRSCGTLVRSHQSPCLVNADQRFPRVDARDPLAPPEIVGDVLGHLLGDRRQIGHSRIVSFVTSVKSDR